MPVRLARAVRPVLILYAASAYTEMNAVSKGVSIGVHASGKGKEASRSTGGSQPYVELMGRR